MLTPTPHEEPDSGGRPDLDKDGDVMELTQTETGGTNGKSELELLTTPAVMCTEDVVLSPNRKLSKCLII